MKVTVIKNTFFFGNPFLVTGKPIEVDDVEAKKLLTAGVVVAASNLVSDLPPALAKKLSLKRFFSTKRSADKPVS